MVTKYPESAELFPCEIINVVNPWLESAALTLAEKKQTQIVFINKRRERNYARIRIGNDITTSKPTENADWCSEEDASIPGGSGCSQFNDHIDPE